MQIKAATKVNQEMLMFYWSLGKDIVEMKVESKWGSGLLKNLSQDLRDALPNQNGFSITNLGYMKRFYLTYVSICPQVGDELDSSQIYPQVGGELFRIPWGHHKYIMDKCGSDTNKAIFYVNKVLENNWSRAVLLNWLGTDLYTRQGKAISNFNEQLSLPQGDLAQEITKDPYNFDFLTLTEKYNEVELKNALVDNIVKFLIELGSGFAFVGREYRLGIGETEKIVDLLFYNIKLHCYVVIEVKTDKFDSANIGQLGTYIVAVNHILKSEIDNPTIGLLICKGKDSVLAQYALESSNVPIGISEYELSKLYPSDFKGSLPSIAEIEQQLS
jgi:predicted nuclease of restriction endonuclease-like (RecB) superfamily